MQKAPPACPTGKGEVAERTTRGTMSLQQVMEEEFSWLTEPWQLLGWLCWLHPGAGAVRKCQELAAPLAVCNSSWVQHPLSRCQNWSEFFSFLKFPQGYFLPKSEEKRKFSSYFFSPRAFGRSKRGSGFPPSFKIGKCSQNLPPRPPPIISFLLVNLTCL